MPKIKVANMKNINIDVAAFSETPFGRFATDSAFSAEHFRENVLIPALKDADGGDIEVDFTRVALGVGSSFLEEAFGGLVRNGFNKEHLIKHITIIDRIGFYDTRVKDYIMKAKQPA